jgi:hypothetical protein
MAWVLDLGKSCPERRLEHGSRIFCAQLKPGAQARLLVIGCIVGELDTEMSAARKTDHQHGLFDSRELCSPYRTAQDRLKALSQFPAPVRAREDMHIAAKTDHDVAGPFLPIPESPAAHLSGRYILPRGQIATFDHAANGVKRRGPRQDVGRAISSVGSRELGQPRAEGDEKPVMDGNLCVRAFAQGHSFGAPVPICRDRAEWRAGQVVLARQQRRTLGPAPAGASRVVCRSSISRASPAVVGASAQVKRGNTARPAHRGRLARFRRRRPGTAPPRRSRAAQRPGRPATGHGRTRARTRRGIAG